MQEMQETQVRSLGQEDPYGINGSPLQYSCLENSMGRGAWWATVHGVPKSWTWLSRSTDCISIEDPDFHLGIEGNCPAVCLSVGLLVCCRLSFTNSGFLTRFYSFFLLFYDLKELTKHSNYLFFESLNK